MLSTEALDADGRASLVFFLAVVPICLWVAWSDMKSMKIPNLAVVALIAVFVLLGPLLLALDEYLWRYVHLAAVLAAGFLLSIAGQVGAGDAKFAAAMAPFVALGDAGVVLVLFAAMLLAAFATHRLFRHFPALRRAGADWRSWTLRKDFPMGFALAGTLLAYLGLAAAKLA